MILMRPNYERSTMADLVWSSGIYTAGSPFELYACCGRIKVKTLVLDQRGPLCKVHTGSIIIAFPEIAGMANFEHNKPFVVGMSRN